MPILDAVRKFIRGLMAAGSEPARRPSPGGQELLAELFSLFPFSAGAQAWLRQHVRVQLDDPVNMSGGGGFYPDLSLVRLNGPQYEAAIHELSHAVWHERRRDRQVRDGLVAAVQRLAQDDDPQWDQVRVLAQHYIYGIPTQPGFERGMLLPEQERGIGGGPQGEWNDWEIYAGLASGCMADIRLLPPYLRRFYADLFDELPAGAPSPVSRAPHR